MYFLLASLLIVVSYFNESEAWAFFNLSRISHNFPPWLTLLRLFLWKLLNLVSCLLVKGVIDYISGLSFKKEVLAISGEVEAFVLGLKLLFRMSAYFPS